MIHAAQTPVRTVPPAATPVSLAEAKAHCRVDDADQDSLITRLIEAATAHLDGWTGVLGRSLVTQTWAQSFAAFPAGRSIRLPLAPVQSIASIGYRDTSDAEQVLASSAYHLVTDAIGARVLLDEDADWPDTHDRPDAVTVAAVCGYGDAGDVPEAIRQAILMMVGHWFENREAVGAGVLFNELPMAVQALLTPYRRVGL